METKNIAAQEPMIGEGVGFERIRRITGYLVGTLDRFNNGKRAEEHDRVKHSVSSCCFTRSCSSARLPLLKRSSTTA